MTDTHTITIKGQITIPKTFRDRLGLKPGVRGSFRVNNQGELVLEAPKTFAEIHAMLGKPTGSDPLSEKELMIVEGMKKDGHKAFR